MMDIKTALDDLISIIHSDQISSAARTTIRGFSQSRKITLQDVLLFYIFRYGETTNKDIAAYFSKLSRPRASKQAMFKALNKTNPEVFPAMIRKYAELFYEHQCYNTLDGWIVLACDGSRMDLPGSEELKNKFGGYLNQTITDKSKVKRPQATCSVLVDVLNHVVLDASIEPCMTSELPLLYRHLENCRELLHGKKVMILCDRYYGSAELFLYCMLFGYKLLVRAKSHMYKDKVKEIERDGMIQLNLNKPWLKRMKRDDCRDYGSKNPDLDIRVVKNHYEYTLDGYKRTQKPITVDSIYMTNLWKSEFPTEKIIELYHSRRWDNETAYFGIKNHLEAERFNSGKSNIVINELFGKILCYSICGTLFDRADEIILDRRMEEGISDTLYDCLPNLKNICDTIRADHRFLQCFFPGYLSDDDKTEYLRQLEDDCSRNTVPVRPGRHYRRWGRWVSSPPIEKFRIDGRRNPPIKKCFNVKGYMTVSY